MLDLEERVSELEEWENGRALLVHGADNTFCSGGDLALMKALLAEPEGGARMSAFMHDTLLRFDKVHYHAHTKYGEGNTFIVSALRMGTKLTFAQNVEGGCP